MGSVTDPQPDPFRALVVSQEDGVTRAEVQDLDTASLPDGNVTVRVAYSSLNYKDGLAVTGKGRVIRTFPMVPGIDLAGTVVASDDDRYTVGDEVILTGWGSGETHWGGYTQLTRVNGDWLVPMPEGLDARSAMAIGTAGFTAMLSVMALQDAGVTPDDRPVVVSGATGGVGSMAVALLSRLGYSVVAATGKDDMRDYLRELGAAEIIDRSEIASPARPLESERWGGAVDAVGGDTLAAILAATARGGAVAACGNAAGVELHTTVFPFILRGVSLLGIDSNTCPVPRRLQAWKRLALDLSPAVIDAVEQTASLDEVRELSEQILAGRLHGRTVIDVNR